MDKKRHSSRQRNLDSPTDLKYLFVFREGSSDVFVTTTAPTSEDLERVRFGLLDVIRLPDMRQLGKNGRWRTVEEGVLGTTTGEGEKIGPWHMPLRWAEEDRHGKGRSRGPFPQRAKS